ncbi:hypothetical protein RSAG8_02498, partial [Rhizoctonia solani AG-8 WAC10335]
MADIFVEEEICGNIFHDPKFFEHFLSGPLTKLDAVLKYCRKSNVYAQRTNSWNSTPRVTRRSGSEPPLLKFLNTIIRGTHATSSPNPRVPSFDRAGILYSSVVDLCKDAETFIRAFASLMMLDRADEGFDTFFSTKKNADNLIVYYLDLPSDVIPQSDSDHEESPTRKFQVREILRHGSDIVGSATTVLLLREAFKPTKREPTYMPTRGKGKRKRAEAAPVEEERIGDTSYILKIVWRDPREFKESDLYEKTNGMYGLAQHTWAHDASRRCTCAEPKEECTTCVVEVGHIAGLEVCEVLSDLVFTRKEFDPQGDDKEGPELDTSEYFRATRKRSRLVYSYIMMSSIGVPLDDAETPHQYMNAVLDAATRQAYRVFNLGYIHRDISDGNILMLKPEQVFSRREWKEPVTELSDIQDEDIRNSEQKLREVVAKLDRDPTGMLIDFNLCVQHSGNTPVESKSEHSGNTPVESKSEVEFHGFRKRMAEMMPFGRRKRRRPNTTKSYAFRDTSEPPPSDSEAEIPVVEYRTGTRPFMSAAVLGSTFGKPYRHTYLDDLESVFWLV